MDEQGGSLTTDYRLACLPYHCLLAHYRLLAADCVPLPTDSLSLRTADARGIPQTRHVHRVAAEALQVKDECKEKGGTHNGKHATQSVVRYKVGPPT